MRRVNSEVRSSKYQQVAVAVAKRIADGDYEVGEKLKSRSTLASTFNVSPETARKGLNILADMQILTLKHGSGAIVLSKEKAEAFLSNYESTHSAINDRPRRLHKYKTANILFGLAQTA